MIKKYIENLNGIIPAKVLEKIPEIKEIDGPLRLCHFLSQCHHESAGFNVMSENLNYNKSGLLKIFDKYFDGYNSLIYANRPIAIANRVYANRMGNGNEESGDGWKYRGRGYIQLTGHDNYAAFSLYIKDDCLSNPDFVADKYPLNSAAWFFTNNNIWKICDKGTVESVTRKVNGGVNGLKDRVMLFNKFYKEATK